MHIRSRILAVINPEKTLIPTEDVKEFDPAYLFGKITILVELYIHGQISKVELEDWNEYYNIRPMRTSKIKNDEKEGYAQALSNLIALLEAFFITRRIGRAGMIVKFEQIKKRVII